VLRAGVLSGLWLQSGLNGIVRACSSNAIEKNINNNNNNNSKTETGMLGETKNPLHGPRVQLLLGAAALSCYQL
jgi:hypothetical protein